MSSGQGFIAALDQSGGSTPKALKLYGIEELEYNNSSEMYNLIHEMRTRIIKSSAFNSKRILAAILFENTMLRQIDELPTAIYLWEKLQIVPFLKIDKGLCSSENHVQLLKPISDLETSLKLAKENKIFGTKMRSLIKGANKIGIKDDPNNDNKNDDAHPHIDHLLSSQNNNNHKLTTFTQTQQKNNNKSIKNDNKKRTKKIILSKTKNKTPHKTKKTTKKTLRNPHKSFLSLSKQQISQINNNHSTTTAVIHVHERWLEAADKNLLSASCLLDQTAAFDLLCHQTLNEKLKLYNFDNLSRKGIIFCLNGTVTLAPLISPSFIFLTKFSSLLSDSVSFL